jgi:hypothetical protein
LLPKKVGHNFDELSLETRISAKFGRSASMADLDEFFVDKLNTSLTGNLQKLDLRLHKEVESQFGDEQAWPGTSRISDGCPDIENGEVCGGINGF